MVNARATCRQAFFPTLAGGWSAEFKDPQGHVLSMYQPADKPQKR